MFATSPRTMLTVLKMIYPESNDVYNMDNVNDSFNNFSQTFNDLYELRFSERKIKFTETFTKFKNG